MREYELLPHIVYKNIDGIHYIAQYADADMWEGFYSETGEGFRGFGLRSLYPEQVIYRTKTEREKRLKEKG